MRCECCDRKLSNKEATAQFVNEDPAAPARYVGMCTECQRFLPRSVRVLTRFDLEDEADAPEDEEIEEYGGRSDDDENEDD